MVPKIQKRTRESHIELTWEEIPLDQRNGIIQGYKIFYWNENEHVNGGLKIFTCLFGSHHVLSSCLKYAPWKFGDRESTEILFLWIPLNFLHFL